ncbi:hypothetical protein [Streptomyces sp. 1-11]|uniref:hypothetical protein n=1 Tax=Streptomyces sp. 1-11 TaxID=2590549 RepID=UPI00116C38BC|nr:hypothetical protein [Streptomyces sp. 1-11]GEK01926.1 hypothetical protein TNCT1_42020 [Streptomyces sp. 1-11]
MAEPANRLREQLAEFIVQQRRLDRAAAWGEPIPARLADATQLLRSARSLLTSAEHTIRQGPEPAEGIGAEEACTCLAIVVPSLLASVGYEDPPPPTFTGILADLTAARDTLGSSSAGDARAEALECLDRIIDLVGEEAEKALAGEVPDHWRLRLRGAVRVSRALIPHVATTTAIALVSSGSGGPFTAALSTVGTSIAALLLPTARSLRDLFQPPELRPSVVALHRTAAETAMRQGEDLLAAMGDGDDETARHWAEQAHAAALLHLRVLADVPGESTLQLTFDVADLGAKLHPRRDGRSVGRVQRIQGRRTAGIRPPGATDGAEPPEEPMPGIRPPEEPRPGSPNAASTPPSVRRPAGVRRRGGIGFGGD